MEFKLPQSTDKKSGKEKESEHRELIVIGGGPAGLTAAIYAGRAARDTAVLVGPGMGGQISVTEAIENYPGFPEGITGNELSQRILKQAKRFGAEVLMETTERVDLSERPYTVETNRAKRTASSIIIATGAVPKMLGVPGETEFLGKGVSTCATCDGFFYRDKDVVVVGGGDAALDEGLFLTKFAREVKVIHRRDELRATHIYQQRAFGNPKMSFVWDTVVEEILGNETVTGVQVRNVKTGEVSVIDTNGVFIYIGMVPGTDPFEGQVEMDDSGYIITDKRQRTNVPGVFAAGDVQSPDHRQVVVAAGTGAIAAIEADRFLDAQGNEKQAKSTIDVLGRENGA